MFQQLTLIGNLGGDPEMRYTPSGKAVTNFSVAVTRSWTDANGERQEKTIWFRVNCWDKMALTAAQYLTKGRQVFVIGEIEEPRVFTDRNGEHRAALDVRAHTIKFLGKAADGKPAQVEVDEDGNTSASPAPAKAPVSKPAAQQPPKKAPAPPSAPPPPSDELEEEDIPF